MSSFASQREKLLLPEPDVLLTCLSIDNLTLLKLAISITLTSSVQQYNIKHCLYQLISTKFKWNMSVMQYHVIQAKLVDTWGPRSMC